MRAPPAQFQSCADAELRRWLECALAAERRRSVRVIDLRRRPSPFASLFPADEVSALLDTGESVSLFIKYLGPEESDHPEKQCRDREIRVYEELLGDPGLPVSRYYGTRTDPATARRQVFLEFLDDFSLQYHDIEYWYVAARRLGQMHAHFATRRERLLARAFLLRFDASYLTDWASRARLAVAEWLPELARDVEPVVEKYQRVIAPIIRQPVTLVHNDLAPKNVIASRATDPPRIALVDWEMAGVGCGALDLVHLKHGLDSDRDRRMCDAYFQGLSGTDLVPPDPAARARLLAACDLHATMYRLAFGRRWGVLPETMARWVADVRRLHESL